MDSWISFSWLLPDTLRGFSWQYPVFLVGVPLIPVLLLLRHFFHGRIQQKIPVAVLPGQLRRSPVRWLRLVPEVLIGLALIFALVALARPQRVQQGVVRTSDGIDIVLMIDVSESMLAKDLTPNRLEAAKQVAGRFVNGRQYDRIGIVVFSGDAYSLVPLTTDYDLVRGSIYEIRQDMIATGGTAIGSALAVAINRMRESSAKSKVGILLSDGDNTAGNLDPIAAAQLARAYNITLYTIAVGQDGRVSLGKNAAGKVQYAENSVDESTLREIARIGNGQFFRAANRQTLGQIFSRINQFEKAEIKETRFQETQDFYWVYLRWAVMGWLLWLLTKSTFMSNALED